MDFDATKGFFCANLAPQFPLSMKHNWCLFAFATLIFACQIVPQKTSISVKYPTTTKVDSIDIYFDVQVKDPYRWLEDDRSTETEAWVKDQNNDVWLFGTDPISSRVERIALKNYGTTKNWAPLSKKALSLISIKTMGYKTKAWSIVKKKEGKCVFLDPNTFSEDGTTSLAGLSFTKDGSLAAYQISVGGSDWRKGIVMDTQTMEIVEDTLVDIKFSGISWMGNEGYYYSSYDKPKGSELSAKTDQHKVYYHQLGTPQKSDVLVYGGTPAQKHRYIGATVTEDEHYLIISASNSTSGNKLFLKDLTKPNSELVTISDNEESDSFIIDNMGSKLFIVTNRNAPNKKMVSVDASNPTPEHWVDFVPQTEHVLSPNKGGGYFFAEYMIDAISKVLQYDYDGKLVREVKLPGVGSVSGFGGKKEEKEIYFSFTNYIIPGSSYQFQVETGEYKLFWKPEIDFNPEDYESKQIFYHSKDGTKVPMLITSKKGLELNGKNPTILYGYGGFDISLTPSFSVVNAVWMEQGGVYAVPNLRGGGEYGKEWHDAGIKTNKQNVFDDFIAAAEYLIDNKYTSPDFLAIRGGSNGGLLVGATMTQRPDLMKVALPAVGVMDMLRYHTFTAGAGWAYDYGTAQDSKEMFDYLKGYSPLHNVKPGVSYPATLVTTGDHDDRVVPAHSFKFAAELQEKQTGDNPTLIRIETNAGHGAGTPVSKTIEQYADIFAFTFYNMGYETLPNQSVLKEFKD